ncbi:MarR family winged helix-turn-helix transcriptional regulator [Herminiimonas sp. CN]|uniref:MarR family winged helix-turn-helix transcriptional regulator n=1 Tax=Herminiimonas sp. CN TaxID=1349818 RepID=UPI00047362F4|nr:MarR family transcriptional regulator [Herminiimonas sp. CN]
MKERYLRSLRLLSECYHSFEQMSGADIRKTGLTQAQFDIIVTLGNTAGMTFKELGRKTLITKGTLTGVIDRLETRQLVRRISGREDRRNTIVQLTAAGERTFEQVFDPHIQFCKQPFSGYTETDFITLEETLEKLKNRLDATIATTKTAAQGRKSSL